MKAKAKISHVAQVTEQKARKQAGRSGGKNIQNSAASAGTSSISLDTNNKGKGKAKSTVKIASKSTTRRPTIPFRATDKILLIGEGNFSFARSLIEDPPTELQSLPPANITATAFDTEEECYAKYTEAEDIVAKIKERGVHVLFGVDGTKLEKHSALKGKKWDRIVWNFPHAGKGITDQDRNILSNQMLILGFLRSAEKMLTVGEAPSLTSGKKKKRTGDDEDEDDDEDMAAPAEEIAQDDSEEFAFFVPSDESIPTRGTVLITLRNVVPYTQWYADVPRLAKKPPAPMGSTPPNPRYTLLRSFQFHREAWKGYEHRMTKGERVHGTGKTGEGGEDRTWEFFF
ncbi:uncharacterized protein LACBIDRAFT_228395 [Laccaria bicolor S238N-H82]|uniref:Predicted protein n=1 Tax=Laccaria bicolor (strain S238N-H82 / ATCC MYA-4686) TaxID=486041 RepID=B0CNG3_LACBS|nr:uncharacterized protein LACBIDRAFT_228395 [Laccaria bicolor S238N-H82]EDR15301.1 predicted protein [Laccaria bicolor S238N-H82]|eukprot:XP_001873509.1 predicted protein [Laccaria bicolor S238N-H82]